jgi:hypothetical protein
MCELIPDSEGIVKELEEEKSSDEEMGPSKPGSAKTTTKI